MPYASKDIKILNSTLLNKYACIKKDTLGVFFLYNILADSMVNLVDAVFKSGIAPYYLSAFSMLAFLDDALSFVKLTSVVAFAVTGVLLDD